MPYCNSLETVEFELFRSQAVFLSVCFVYAKRCSSFEFQTHIERLIIDNASKVFSPITFISASGQILEGFTGKSKEKYVNYIRHGIGEVQIFRLNKPIPIEEIYIESRLFTEEESIFSFKNDRSGDLAYGRRAYRKNNTTLVIKDVLSETDRLMVLGDPGAGKSTLLKGIALSSISDHECLADLDFGLMPIYIELRKYAEVLGNQGSISLMDYFNSEFNNENFREIMAEIIKNKGAIFLLDALDEVPPRHQKKVIDEISNLSMIFSGNKIIVSSRIGHKMRLKGFNIHELSDFSEQERNSFIEKWMCATNRPEKAKGLIQEIRFQNGIREITSNPLLLSLICILYLREISLPSRRAAVYKRCIEVLINEWDAEREFIRTSRYSRIDNETKIKMLSDIAVYYTRQGERYFLKDNIIEVAKKVIEKFEVGIGAAEFVEEVFSHHGIIVEAGHEMYGFSHLTFQEYLSAKYFVENGEYEEMARRYDENSSWREIMSLAASESANIKPLIGQVIKYDKINDYEKLVIIATCLGNNAIVPPEFRKELVDVVKIIALDLFKKHPYTLITGDEKIRIKDLISKHCDERVLLLADYMDKMTLLRCKGEYLSLASHIHTCREKPWFVAEFSNDELNGLKEFEKKVIKTLFSKEDIIYIDSFFDYFYCHIMPRLKGMPPLTYAFVTKKA